MTNGRPRVAMPCDGWAGLRAIFELSTQTVVWRPSLTTARCIHPPTGSAWLHEVGSASRSWG